MNHTQWVTQAACRPNPSWTPETRPTTHELAAMQQICAQCPVIKHCATYALHPDVEPGIYAGTWLPSRHTQSRLARNEARRKLQHISEAVA